MGFFIAIECNEAVSFAIDILTDCYAVIFKRPDSY
jgi:hypothetical protein